MGSAHYSAHYFEPNELCTLLCCIASMEKRPCGLKNKVRQESFPTFFLATQVFLRDGMFSSTAKDSILDNIYCIMTFAFSYLSAVCFNLGSLHFSNTPTHSWYLQGCLSIAKALPCLAVSLAFLSLDLFFLHWSNLCIFPLHLLSFLFLLSFPTTHTFFLLRCSGLSLPCVLPFMSPFTRWGMFSKGFYRLFAYHSTLK